MKTLKFIGLVITAVGVVLALSMFALIQYALMARPNEGAVILPPLVLILGIVIAAVGLLLLVIALIGLHIQKKQALRPGHYEE
jgi:protein-S-isoprenylcysteine O-methyltransferase Ste14